MFGAEGLWRLLEGQVIKEQFYLQTLLGAGAYGGVFRTDEVVRDTCLRSLATKLISLQNPDQVGRQLQELQVALRLDHPNLIRCHGAGEVTLAGNSFLYLLMELAEGTLQERLEQGSVSPDALLPIIRDVAAGLAHLHQSQQSHLDIKPGNILKVGDAKGTAKAARWKIGDYGLMHTLNSSRSCTVTKNPLGTPLYMPPESYDGVVSSAWDMWSLGIMTASLLTGQYPISYRTENELSQKIKTGNFDNLRWDNLPSPWRSIIEGCLQINRGDRWTAEQILKTLNPKASPPVIQYPTFAEPTGFETIIENLGEGVILELIKLPAGSFLMGSPDNDPDGKDKEKPQHTVNIKSFAMGKYPVTQAQYEVVMGENPSGFKGNPNHPVETVGWYDVKLFCKKLSEKTGRKYRLPTEAEWEYACRAGTTTRYSFGNSVDQLGKHAWFGDNSNGHTHPIGRKKPNNWGLYDMYGQVWEWCEDMWHDNYREAPADGTAWNNNHNERRVIRGGCWSEKVFDTDFNFAYLYRSAFRDYKYSRAYRNCIYGFRVVVSS